MEKPTPEQFGLSEKQEKYYLHQTVAPDWAPISALVATVVILAIIAYWNVNYSGLNFGSIFRYIFQYVFPGLFIGAVLWLAINTALWSIWHVVYLAVPSYRAYKRYTSVKDNYAKGSKPSYRVPVQEMRLGYSVSKRMRSTPTCVGTMPPRVIPPFFAYGPPPHAWGQCLLLPLAISVVGSTPTCVGTISHVRASNSGRQVHPHMRGDNAQRLEGDGCAMGPPPHAWGQY